jgi:hypothetical protein
VTRERRWIAAAASLAPLAVGAILRLWHLPHQILGGDELHAVRAALEMRLGEILTTFRTDDHCIPLSAFDHFLLDRGVRLTEAWVRLPVVLAGLASLVLVPWAVAHRLRGRERRLLAWLVALSPLLVIYSRIVRPYLPMVVLGFVAFGAFDRWWLGVGGGGGPWRWAAAYGAAAAGTIWLHPVAAPFVLSPLVFAAGDALLRHREGLRRRLVALAGLGAGVLLLLAALVGPAARSLLAVAAAKGGKGQVHWKTVAAAARLQAGTGETLVALAFWAVALAGLALLARRDRSFAAYGVTLAGAYVAAVAVLSPFGAGHPLVFDRYLLLLLPLLLTWAAVGLAALARPGWGPLARVLPAVAVAGLAAAGPLVRPAWWRTSFAGHNDFVQFERPLARMPAAAVPPFYRHPPAPGPLVEYPWPSAWHQGRSLYVYQQIHRRRVLVCSPEPRIRDPRLAFRNLVPPTPAALLASGARFLVIHRDLAAEERRLVDEAGRRGGIPKWRRKLLRQAAAAFAGEIRAAWGKPAYADPTILAWDLARARAGGSGGLAGGGAEGGAGGGGLAGEEERAPGDPQPVPVPDGEGP